MELLMETGKCHAYWYLLCCVLRLNPLLSCAYSLFPNIAQITDRNKVRFVSPFFPPNSLPSDFHCYQSGGPFLLSEATMVNVFLLSLQKEKHTHGVLITLGVNIAKFGCSFSWGLHPIWCSYFVKEIPVEELLQDWTLPCLNCTILHLQWCLYH
jgi:hypothetical protein